MDNWATQTGLKQSWETTAEFEPMSQLARFKFTVNSRWQKLSYFRFTACLILSSTTGSFTLDTFCNLELRIVFIYLSVFPFFTYSFFLVLHSPPLWLLNNSSWWVTSHLSDCGMRRWLAEDHVFQNYDYSGTASSLMSSGYKMEGPTLAAGLKEVS